MKCPPTRALAGAAFEFVAIERASSIPIPPRDSYCGTGA
jgi:hypothetical protein